MTPSELVDRGALFVINHSGGKDSQAMTSVLRRIIPADQLVVIHANLGEVEWPGVVDHIKSTIGDLPLIICKNENKTFLEMVEHRGMFPSPQQRQCTSDLKRGPIEREIRRYLRANSRFKGLVVNCMGLRSEESPNRAKKQSLKFSKGNSLAGRLWYDWLPIQHLTLDQVWEEIRSAGQTPHPAYSLGMTRLSCVFCIMSSDSDLKIAAKHNPHLLARYSEIENRIGRTMMMPRRGVPMTLQQITGA
jgi:3'-phosphoadenosine 5'-phosphosulfate sulfotransferase (PAPS reductase)/FAD synthetase